MTWVKAICAGNYAIWLYLTIKTIQKHFLQSDETPKGPIQNVKQHIRSTKEKKIRTVIKNGEAKVGPLKKHQDIYIQVNKVRESIYTNQTGAFPVCSKVSNHYIMLMYEMASNAILTESMQNQSARKMVHVYKILIEQLKPAGITPKKAYP